MPAAPFGGHPTLAQYLVWAREHGCHASSGILSDEDGRIYPATKIEAPSGKKVTLVGTDQSERLVPTMIGYLDRRLGLSSPFFSLDDPSLDPKNGG